VFVGGVNGRCPVAMAALDDLLLPSSNCLLMSKEQVASPLRVFFKDARYSFIFFYVFKNFLIGNILLIMNWVLVFLPRQKKRKEIIIGFLGNLICRNVFKLDELGMEIAQIAFPAALALTADPIASLVDTAFIGQIGLPPTHQFQFF